MKKHSLLLTVSLLILLSFVSCGKQVDLGESDTIAVSVAGATDEQLSSEDGYVHFYDTDSKQVDLDESDTVAVSVAGATDEQLSSEDGYVHFYDTDSINTEWKILLTVESQVESLSFIEIDESEVAKVGKVLFEEKAPRVGDSYVFHTYINDATLSRGISYSDESGNVRYFGIAVSMKDGTVYLKEIAA